MKKIKEAFRYLIISALLVLHSINAQTQLWVPGSDEMLNKLRLDKNISGIGKISYANFDGNPFIYKDFYQGKLVLKNGEIYQLDMRYDIYSDQIQFKEQDQIYSFIRPDNLAYVVIDTLRFLYSDYTNSQDEKAKTESSYFILKTDGRCKLLVKKNIRIQEAEPPKIYQDAKPPKFIITADTYYLKKENKSAIRIKTKKDILLIMSDKNDEISKFIDSGKLGTKNTDDLGKIVSFYNGL